MFTVQHVVWSRVGTCIGGEKLPPVPTLDEALQQALKAGETHCPLSDQLRILYGEKDEISLYPEKATYGTISPTSPVVLQYGVWKEETFTVRTSATYTSFAEAFTVLMKRLTSEEEFKAYQISGRGFRLRIGSTVGSHLEGMRLPD